jgi:hypothetical protein
MGTAEQFRTAIMSYWFNVPWLAISNFWIERAAQEMLLTFILNGNVDLIDIFCNPSAVFPQPSPRLV